jgi:hypothetical protein
MGLRAGRLSLKFDGIEREEAWEIVCCGKGAQSLFDKVGRGYE